MQNALGVRNCLERGGDSREDLLQVRPCSEQEARIEDVENGDINY